MKKSDTALNEETRLHYLRSLKILDTPPEERFDRLTRLAKRLFNVPVAMVSLVDENRQWFKSSVGMDVTETPRESSFCAQAIKGDDILLVTDATKDVRFADNPMVVNEPFVRFYAGCPLKYLDGSKLGTLCVIDNRPRSVSQDDLDAFRDLAELVERELAAVHLATMDELTGISNRRGFKILAENSLNLCMRHHIPASLVFFDINSFKTINDTYGHQEGDAALIAFAEQMKMTFRDSDVIARLGGDEFVVLLTNTTIDLAKELIERFQTSITTYNKEAARGYDITFSTGTVEVDTFQPKPIDFLLSQADSLMYQHKHGHSC